MPTAVEERMTAHEILDLISGSEADDDHVSPALKPANKQSNGLNDSFDEESPIITRLNKRKRDDASDEEGLIEDDSDQPDHISLDQSVDEAEFDDAEFDDDEIGFDDDDDDNDSHASLGSVEPDLKLSNITDDPSKASKTALKKRLSAGANRYFADSSISIKCFNCGSGGHIAAECEKDRIVPPCYICGHRSHPESRNCPRELCHRCGEEGHMVRDCRNPRFTARICYRCGSTDHLCTDCVTPPSALYWDLSQLHCYVCGKPGHINCTPPSFSLGGSSAATQCSNCASKYHGWTQCKSERMPQVPVVEYNDPRRGTPQSLATMECFQCGQLGHGKRDCPNRGQGRRPWQQNNQIVGRSGGANGTRQPWSESYREGARRRDEQNERKGQNQRRPPPQQYQRGTYSNYSNNPNYQSQPAYQPQQQPRYHNNHSNTYNQSNQRNNYGGGYGGGSFNPGRKSGGNTSNNNYRRGGR